MVPVNGGLSFRAKIDGLDIPGRARYAVACVDGTNTIRVTASSVVVKGTLLVTPERHERLQDRPRRRDGPDHRPRHLRPRASPATIIDLIRLDTLIQAHHLEARARSMEPMMNQALGGLAGPKKLNVLGKTLTMQVAPSRHLFDPTAASSRST